MKMEHAKLNTRVWVNSRCRKKHNFAHIQNKIPPQKIYINIYIYILICFFYLQPSDLSFDSNIFQLA